MEVSFTELKEKEIVNVSDGKKLGRIIDILFDNLSGSVRGVVVPGEKKVFRKSDDIFIPLDRMKKIGDDVILVSLHVNAPVNYMTQNNYNYNNYYADRKMENRGQKYTNNGSYIRYRRIDNKKYK